MKKIYLAGALTAIDFDEANEWRENIKKEIESLLFYSKETQWEIINPIKLYNYNTMRHKTEKEVMQYDLNHVKSSDLIIVNLKDINTSIGTAIELYVAAQLNIPVLAFGNDKEYRDTHAWIKECISRCDNSMGELLEYISEFYF